MVTSDIIYILISVILISVILVFFAITKSR